MLRFLATVSALTTALAAEARADESHSYRRDIMLADGLATATIGGAFAARVLLYDNSDYHSLMAVGLLGYGGFLLAAPIIHFQHGNTNHGWLSFGARFLIPVTVSATVTIASGLEGHEDGFGELLIGGFALGYVGAVALDWFVLAPSGARASEQSGPAVTPRISASAEHVFLGVGGSL